MMDHRAIIILSQSQLVILKQSQHGNPKDCHKIIKPPIRPSNSLAPKLKWIHNSKIAL